MSEALALAAVDLRAARLHLVGVGGSGMSALAAFQRQRGAPVSGSDRDFDRGERRAIAGHLERAGVELCAQDGSGVQGADLVVASTAVEAEIPDLREARALGIGVVHRSELLAEIARQYETIAVAGSSGKSTVVAMIFEVLEAAGQAPSVITGGALPALQERGCLGNAWVGSSPYLVIEADESDASLVRYAPAYGVLLNLHRDHAEPEVLLALFRRFRSRCRRGFVVSDDRELVEFRAAADWVFGTSEAATLRAEAVELGGQSSQFIAAVGDDARVPVELPQVGAHAVTNALAAIAAAATVGVAPAASARGMAGFRGVARRFQSLGVAAGVEVIDDFAHNPRKIEAALRAAQLRAPGRVLAAFQPHGYGPARFMRDELAGAVAQALRPGDRFWVLDIYDAGGTADRSLTAGDLVADLEVRAAGGVGHVPRRALAAAVRDEARAGDLVLIMGARDPSLPELGRAILAALEQTALS